MAQFVQTFFEDNEHFQQSLRLWSFTETEGVKTLPIPRTIQPFIDACVDAATDGNTCPDFPEELEEQGVKTVDDIAVRVCTEEEFNADSDEEEAEWTSWSDILTTYYEWLTQIQN